MDELNTSWHSYPKLYAIGHGAIGEIFSDDVIIEEKIDGSQFSFGRFGGELKVRSKRVNMLVEEPQKMFAKAIDAVSKLDLPDGWTFRGECLDKPKHNVLCYDRVPNRNVIVFDINTGHETYLSYDDKRQACKDIGFECVPLLHQGKVESPEQLKELMNITSILGGVKVEGIVVKNYRRFTADGKAMMGKFVSEEFKEVHKKTWGESNPSSKDVLELMGDNYRSKARWLKSIQRLRDEDKLEGSPKDIGLLIREIKQDIKEECQQEIADQLFKWAWPHIERKVIKGLPQWYKERLMDEAF